MTVIGFDETSGRYIVSSWGNKFYVDPQDLNNTSMPSTFEVIKYTNKNVEDVPNPFYRQ